MAFIHNKPPEYKLILPLYVGGKEKTTKNQKPKHNKRYWLTLNNYRNWHYRMANNTKILFKEAVQQQVSQLPDLSVLWGQISLHYVLYPPNHMTRDLGNSLSVIDKYFADALVELGKLTDDNTSAIPAISCEVGAVDKVNPRMELFIRPYVKA